MEQQDDILWINTGGTIVAKQYKPKYTLHNPPPRVTVHTQQYSAKLMQEAISTIAPDACITPFTFGTYFDECKGKTLLKDSKDFTAEDIECLADIIANDSHQNILITHGTDWMVRNANRLEEQLKERGVDNKCIIFVGSMVPLSMEKIDDPKGDALRNLATAIKNIKHASSGVYVVGKSYGAEAVRLHTPHNIVKAPIASRNNLELTFIPER